MLRILFINPVSGTSREDERLLEILNEVKRSDVEPKVVRLSKGKPHLEYHYYEHLNMKGILRWVKRAEKKGFDAVIIGCFYDPGLREARELVSIPVVAPAETCMHIAATLGHKFSIIVGRRKWVPKMESNLYQYGLEKKLASFKTINFTVSMMMKKPTRLKEAILKVARQAVEEDGAEVIILGCTALTGLVNELMEKLKVPIIDPVIVTWKYAEMMADLYRRVGLTHCKLYGYEPPPKIEF